MSKQRSAAYIPRATQTHDFSTKTISSFLNPQFLINKRLHLHIVTQAIHLDVLLCVSLTFPSHPKPHHFFLSHTVSPHTPVVFHWGISNSLTWPLASKSRILQISSLHSTPTVTIQQCHSDIALAFAQGPQLHPFPQTVQELTGKNARSQNTEPKWAESFQSHLQCALFSPRVTELDSPRPVQTPLFFYAPLLLVKSFSYGEESGDFQADTWEMSPSFTAD